MEAGARVTYIGDVKQSTLQRGQLGTVVRVRRRGVDVQFDGRAAVTTGVAAAALEVVGPPPKARVLQVFAELNSIDPHF